VNQRLLERLEASRTASWLPSALTTLSEHGILIWSRTSCRFRTCSLLFDRYL